VAGFLAQAFPRLLIHNRARDGETFAGLPAQLDGNAPFFVAPASWLMTWRSCRLHAFARKAASRHGAVVVNLFRGHADDPFTQPVDPPPRRRSASTAADAGGTEVQHLAPDALALGAGRRCLPGTVMKCATAWQAPSTCSVRIESQLLRCAAVRSRPGRHGTVSTS